MRFEQGAEVPTQTYRVTRADLVAYADASGDQNPIHQSDDVARTVGLPGVIAHGMYTLALAARAADTWAGEPGKIVELGAKFTRPVVVPDDAEGVEVTVAGVVKKVEDDLTTLTLTVTCAGEKVLGMPTAVLRG
ncbi:MAG: MaoC/PaaZ C-terminal domain-containing protein [Marmoricola sp.]